MSRASLLTSSATSISPAPSTNHHRTSTLFSERHFRPQTHLAFVIASLPSAPGAGLPGMVWWDEALLCPTARFPSHPSVRSLWHIPTCANKDRANSCASFCRAWWHAATEKLSRKHSRHHPELPRALHPHAVQLTKSCVVRTWVVCLTTLNPNVYVRTVRLVVIYASCADAK